MRNDLTQFEKNLLNSINLFNKTKYNHTNLMEWNSSKDSIEKNLKQDEEIYQALGVYVAIKPYPTMELIRTEVEPNEDSITNSNITYSVYWDSKKQTFVCIKDKNVRGWVSYDECPKEFHYKLEKPIDQFTEDEKINILDYSGLKLSDGFELTDIFMEKSYIK